jgi:hypothetical protein
MIRSKLAAFIFTVSAFSVVISGSGSATDPFVERFRSSDDVRSAIKTLESEGYRIDKEPIVITIWGSCGVVGCYQTVLVIQVMKTQGSNTQTTNVAATIKLFPRSLNKPMEVSMLELPKKDICKEDS